MMIFVDKRWKLRLKTNITRHLKEGIPYLANFMKIWKITIGIVMVISNHRRLSSTAELMGQYKMSILFKEMTMTTTRFMGTIK